MSYPTDPVAHDVEDIPSSRTPETVLIAVLDTSGSMSESASNAQLEESGGVVFSRMDLLKHSMRTVVGMLSENENTSLGIIGFDSAARTVLRTVSMKGDTAVTGANDAIDALYPGGATNIWDGLRAAIQEAEEVYMRNPNADINICLLTDGEPTESLLPPGGLRQTLKTKLKKSVPLKLHTFGFGYNLDSKLLYDMCVMGQGMYGYIPDCSMVGSVFINFCSTILSGKNAVVEDEAFQTGREMLVNVLKGIHDASAVETNPFAAVQQWLTTNETETTAALLSDIDDPDANKGQLMKALSCMDWFKRWGYNHILAYSRALELGVCANFKDQALQLFATESFKEMQAKGNENFADLPAPIPRGYTQATFNSYVQATGFSMSQFNTDDGGCFLGECMVSLADGKKKKVEDCVKGDILDNGSVIRCVVKRSVKKEVKMVKFPLGLTITPWHPVRATTGMPWLFPCLWLNRVQWMYVDSFYDFVLEAQSRSSTSVEGRVLEGEKQWATIDGLQVITLGHGVKDDPVAWHEYYGTQKVIEDLKQEKGWEEGFVEL